MTITYVDQEMPFAYVGGKRIEIDSSEFPGIMFGDPKLNRIEGIVGTSCVPKRIYNIPKDGPPSERLRPKTRLELAS